MIKIVLNIRKRLVVFLLSAILVGQGSGYLAQKLKNKPLTVVGDGKQTRDFTYVTDVVDASYKAAKSKVFHDIYNVGTGKPISVNYIVKSLGGKFVRIPKRPGEPDNSQANINKIRKALNWKPKVKLEDGLKDTIEYFSKILK